MRAIDSLTKSVSTGFVLRRYLPFLTSKFFFKPLTNEERADVFTVDDSLHERTGYKKTQVASRVFNHVSIGYKTGFRLLTLVWSDGNSFVLINYSLLPSSKEPNQLGNFSKVDNRFLTGKRRKTAVTKAMEVVLHLLKYAMVAGLRTRYVLFGSWFSTLHTLVKIKEMDFDSIVMVKVSCKLNYEYEGKRKNIKQIYASRKKCHGRSSYRVSVEAKVDKGTEDEPVIPARIVCVRNRPNEMNWLAVICKDMSLPAGEIIRIYGKRWNIEVYFKSCKSLLNLRTECHILSYDALTAHVAMMLVQ